jgi:undecaprenyl-diphosphatase
MHKLFGVLDARDRALLARLMLEPSATARRRRAWEVVTVGGGARGSIAVALLPLLVALVVPRAAHAAWLLFVDAALILAASHLVVQVIKRTAVRPRPVSAGAFAPDAFSFPSGHACAALAVALAYAVHLPLLAGPAVAVAGIVGYSRIALGVHFPGDVLAGQGIAFLTALAVVAR